MILFCISFILVMLSSYLISSCLARKNSAKGFIYTLLIAHANIIFTSEVLSIFHQIKELPFLIFNFLVFIASFILWRKLGKPIWKIDLAEFNKKFFNSLKLDKLLWDLFIPWVFFILVSLYLIILLPSSSADADTYHVLRSFDWVLNSSLAHFETADIRITAFPINSELLYLWIILFTKKQLFLGSFSFIGYVLVLVSGYQLFKLLHYSMRKTLWSLFIVSSFASVIVMVSGTETDLIIAGLIITSIYLFLDALKNKSDNTTLFIASLSYAIAIGVKTPAIISIPATGLIMLYFSYIYKDYKTILKFLGFGIINFILFSAFNYVQNLIHYGNLMGTVGSILTHKNLWGFKGFIANFIKHFFLFLDFSGIKLPPEFFMDLINFEKTTLTIFNVNKIPNGVFCGTGFFNSTLTEPIIGCGLLSFMLILPCLAISLFKPVFTRNKKSIIEFIFALALIINIGVLSGLISFMTYNTRFLTAFVLISLPIIANSYIKSNKNILKLLYIFIALFYFTIISTHLWGRPFMRIIKYQINHTISVKEFRSEFVCGKFDKRDKKMNDWCVINSLVESKFLNNDNKILVMPSFSSEIIFLKILKLQGHNIDFINLEHIEQINPDIYDVMILPINGQIINTFDKITPENTDYTLDSNGNIIRKNINEEKFCYYKHNAPSEKYNYIPTEKNCVLTDNFFANHPFYFGYRTDKFYILLNKNKFEFLDY